MFFAEIILENEDMYKIKQIHIWSKHKMEDFD